MSEQNIRLERVLSYLPARLASAVCEAAKTEGDIDEIRLVSRCEASLLSGGKLIPLGVETTDEDMRRIIRAVSASSLYSHSETLKEGYIVTCGGIRIGVCGRAVCEGERIVSVTDISGAVIRIPSRRPGFADELFEIMKSGSFRENVMIYSPPSGGKTTILRELIRRLSEYSLRVAVVDTRLELCDGLEGEGVFRLASYPRAKGTEIAVRTLSPDVVVCDEVNTDPDFSALSLAVGCGVTVVASCHADNANDVRRRIAQKTGDDTFFKILYGVNKHGKGIVTRLGAGGAA